MTVSPRAVAPQSLFPGTIVSVPVIWPVTHKGIVSDRFLNGKPLVISNSARNGRVAEESWDTFSQGKAVSVDGYPSQLSSHLVVSRARSRIGTKYDLFNQNCEHLVTEAHGMSPRSAQLAAFITLGVIGLTIAFASN